MVRDAPARVEQAEGTRILVADSRPGAAPSPVSTADEFMATVGHEAAHSWLEPPVPLDAPPLSLEARAEAADNRVRLLACASEWVSPTRWPSPPRKQSARRAPSRALGFTGPSADGEGCARGARLALEREAAATHAAHRVRLFGAPRS